MPVIFHLDTFQLRNIPGDNMLTLDTIKNVCQGQSYLSDFLNLSSVFCLSFCASFSLLSNMSSFASNAMISIITNLFQDEAVHETLNISNDMMLLDLLLTLPFLLFVFVITTQDTHEKASI